MKAKFVLTFICLFLTRFVLIGQFANLIHYTVKDGLPSSTVYSTAQDSKGFLWIGTEAGLARFDGSKFRIFTTQDGLPDNEVLGTIYDGITDRLWLTTYSKAACYYRNGKIYTAKNDSDLLKIKCDFGEFINANYQENNGVFLYNGGTIFECANNKITKFKLHLEQIFQVHRLTDSTFDFACDSGILEYSAGHDKYKYDGFDRTSFQNNVRWMDNILFRYITGRIELYKKQPDGHYKQTGEIKVGAKHRPNRIIRIGTKLYISCPQDGVYLVENTFDSISHMVWSGNVNDIGTDKDGNLWIATTDDGIYAVKRVNQQESRSSIDNLLLQNNITALHVDENKVLYLGNSQGQIFSLKDFKLNLVDIKLPKNIEKIREITTYKNKLYCVSNRTVLYYRFDNKGIKVFPHLSGGPKSLLLYQNGETILVGLLGSLMTIDVKTDLISENQTFRKRFIDIAQHPNGKIFCASLDGLYTYDNSTLNHIETGAPILNGRITSLCFTPDSLLWIGTPATGIAVYDGKRVLTNISQSAYMGYHGTICRKIVKGNQNEVWVATNSGVNRIHYHYTDTLVIDNITPLNINDGLCSDDVNDIQIQDSLIYVASSNGLTILNDNQLLTADSIPIYISSVKINDKDSTIHDDQYHLSYLQNNLKIDFVAISLPSAGYLKYQYRLLGSGSDKWETTTNTSIEFRSLSPGTYTFEAVVLDKFGSKSKSIARVQFKITPAFYMTIWFWAICVILILAIGFYIIRDRFQRQRRQFEKEQGLNNKIIELEQQALKAQMNPHFIFNCLTAVQHFVNSEDMYSANMYLSNFARLIRKTLDLSGEQYISLDKEVAYLQNYVQLEKMRFQEKFQYTIKVSSDIDTYSVEVPPMLLQPIIENAIRHGLRNMDTDTGLLQIEFTKADGKLVCTIDDNGVGMKKARELKTTMHVEYQSKGMTLTTSRINAINMISDKKITIDTIDKYDNNEAAGTLVILRFEQKENI